MGEECLKHETWTHFRRDDWIYAGFALIEIHPTSKKWDHLFWRLNAYSRMILDDFRPKKSSDHRIVLGNCFAKLPKMTKKTARNHSTNPLPAAASWQRAFLFSSLPFSHHITQQKHLSFFWVFPFFEVDVFRNFYCKSLKKKGMFIGNFQKRFRHFGVFLGLRQHPPIWIRDMEGQKSLKLESMRFHRKTYNKTQAWIWTHKHTHTHTCHMEKCIIYGCLGTNRTNDPGFLHTGLPVIKITILEKVSTTCKQIVQ